MRGGSFKNNYDIIGELKDDEKFRRNEFMSNDSDTGDSLRKVFTLAVAIIIIVAVLLFFIVGIFQEPAPNYEEIKQKFIGSWKLDSQEPSMYYGTWTFYENDTVRINYSYYKDKPDITFSKNETQNSLTVTKVEWQNQDHLFMEWIDYEIKSSGLSVITPDYCYDYDFLENGTKLNLNSYGTQIMTFNKTSEPAVNRSLPNYDIEWKNVNITLHGLDTIHWDWINLTGSSISYYGVHAPSEWGNITVGDVIEIGDYKSDVYATAIWTLTDSTFGAWSFDTHLYDYNLTFNNWSIVDTVGWWHFNEGYGDIAFDSSSYGNNGAPQNTQWTSGHERYGLSFSAYTNSAVKIEDDPSLDFDDLGENEGFMIDFWMQNRNTSFIQTYVGLVSKQYYGGYMVTFGNTHKIGFNIKSPNASQIKSVKSNTIINDTLWHHIVAVWSGDTLYIYVDDMETPDNSTYVGNFTIGDTWKWLDIGNDWPTDSLNPFDGKIDEVKICKIKPIGQ